VRSSPHGDQCVSNATPVPTVQVSTNPASFDSCAAAYPSASVNFPHRIVRSALKPLTLAQIFSSAAGAGGMVIAAWAMLPTEFTQFALFTLIGSMVLGLSTSGLFQPALINQRIERNSFVPLRYVAIPASAASFLYLIFALVVGVNNLLDLFLVSGSAAFPVYYNWLRYRAIGFNRRWIVAKADFLRLSLAAAALAAPKLIADSIALQTYFAATTSLPLLFVAIRLPRISRWVPYHRYRRAAVWQVLDWIFGSSLISLPLLLLGGVSRSPLIGGVRLAQSLLGPLNLAFAAATTNLIADGVTKAELTDVQSLISRGALLGRQLMGLSLVAVTTMISFFYFAQISFRGVATRDLILGLALVGAASITSAWVGVHGVVLRLLGRQARVTVARGITAIFTLGTFTAVYYSNGVEASLISGFIVLALTSPLALLCLARGIYRRAAGTDSLGQPANKNTKVGAITSS
jgi:hypothetical protein